MGKTIFFLCLFAVFSTVAHASPLIHETLRAQVKELVQSDQCRKALDLINDADEQQKNKADYGDDKEMAKYNNMHQDLMHLQWQTTLDCDAKRKEIAKEDAEKRNAEAEKAALEKEKIRIDAETKVHKLETCQTTDRYMLFKAQDDIISYLDWIERAKDELKNENEIARVSGYTNKYNRYVAGTEIVEYRKKIKEIWPEYKRLGGKAKAPSKVTPSVKNPCESLE